jgi:hypothetical protein
LVAPIEEPHKLTRDRVERRDPVTLMIVAKGAGEPEIIFLGRPA